MVSIPKVVTVMSCGFLLCLGLSNITQAKDKALTEQQKLEDRTDTRPQAAADKVITIEGEVLRVEGENYFVKDNDKEVRLHIDKTTKKTGNIGLGDRIMAKVNEDHHALSIHSVQSK